MSESNIRFGVVNVVKRSEFEKKFQIPYGYELVTWNEHHAISHCRKKNNSEWIVEKIFDTQKAINNKIEIYRSGNFKEGGNA